MQSRDEIKQLRIACAGYEVVMNELERMNMKKLEYKVHLMTRYGAIFKVKDGAITFHLIINNKIR